MKILISDLLELAAAHVLLLGIYWFFLRNESQHAFRRAYLLVATGISLIVPLLHIPQLWTYQNPKIVVETLELSETVLQPVQLSDEASFSFELTDALIWIYALISIWFLAHILLAVYKLTNLAVTHRNELVHGFKVKLVHQLTDTFTFFRWIFINKNLPQTEDNIEAILQHEQAHAELAHTYDIIFFQLFRAAFWWLPTAWWQLREMKKIHEYQADAYALKSIDVSRYSKILISNTLKANGINLASSFHDGFTLKRIQEMKRKFSAIRPWKIGTVAAITMALVIGFACNEEMDKNLNELKQSNNSITFDQLPEAMQNQVRDYQNQLTFTKLVVPESEAAKTENYFANLEELKAIDPSTIHSMNVDKPNRTVYIAIKKDGAYFEQLAEKSKVEDEVFTIVEEQPQYPGGMPAFYKYIGDNINYPKEAREAGVEGRVYVQFVVDKEGNVTDVKPVKGIGAGCDEEAVRIMQGAEKFTPGYQRGRAVSVRMVLPIIFKLAPENKNVIIIEELETNDNQMKVNGSFQNGTWSGTVVNAETMKPMAGVSIVESGTTSGTVSDQNGQFKLKLQDESHDVTLSYVGYKTLKVTTE